MYSLVLACAAAARRVHRFYGVFGVSSAMYLFSFYYGWTQVKEQPKKWSGDGPEPQGLTGFLRDFFDMQYLLETFRTSFKKGPNNRRLRVVLLMVVVMLVIGPMHGENTVMYLFVRRKFNWDELDFSLFSTYCVIVNLIGSEQGSKRVRNECVHNLSDSPVPVESSDLGVHPVHLVFPGTMLSVGLFSSLLKYDDSVIGMMSCASKIVAGFVYAFANTVAVVRIGKLGPLH